MGQGLAIPLVPRSFSLLYLPLASANMDLTTRNRAVVAFARQGSMTLCRNRKIAHPGQARYSRMIASAKGDYQTPSLKMIAFR